MKPKTLSEKIDILLASHADSSLAAPAARQMLASELAELFNKEMVSGPRFYKVGLHWVDIYDIWLVLADDKQQAQEMAGAAALRYVDFQTANKEIIRRYLKSTRTISISEFEFERPVLMARG